MSAFPLLKGVARYSRCTAHGVGSAFGRPAGVISSCWGPLVGEAERALLSGYNTLRVYCDALYSGGHCKPAFHDLTGV